MLPLGTAEAATVSIPHIAIAVVLALSVGPSAIALATPGLGAMGSVVGLGPTTLAPVTGFVAAEHARGLVASLPGVPDGASSWWAQEHRNLALAQQLLGEGPLDAAQAATRWQATTLGLSWPPLLAAERHASPSSAMLELLARHGIEPSADQLAAILQLDEHDASVRSSLTDVVAAFLQLEIATRQTFGTADADAWRSFLAQPTLHLRLAPGALDMVPVLAARTAFLDAFPAFRDALAQAPVTVECRPVAVPPVFSIDLSACDNTYTDDVALQLDAGGNDQYRNNAGGSGVTVAGATGLLGTGLAAALLDLGAGADVYGVPEAPRSNGVNGGAYLGAGLLVDGGGNDRYLGGGWGTNGGSAGGSGLLLDLGGDDLYIGGDHGTNGGTYYNNGALLDHDGDDAYLAGGYGTNGGGVIGAGLLFDRAGHDAYVAGHYATNGGGFYGAFAKAGDLPTPPSPGSIVSEGGGPGGVGFLLDQAGHDHYTAGDFATNGGGFEGVGFLLDQGGHDVYSAGEVATNGGAYYGLGFLVDFAGDDTYATEHFGDGPVSALPYPHPDVIATNGGAYFGAASLVDQDGADTYQDPQVPGGACVDCSVLLKGTAGFQWDNTPFMLDDGAFG